MKSKKRNIAEQLLSEVTIQEALTTFSTNKEETEAINLEEANTTMQTTKVIENIENGDIITTAKRPSITSTTLEEVSDEEEDFMIEDIPGIQFSITTEEIIENDDIFPIVVQPSFSTTSTTPEEVSDEEEDFMIEDIPGIQVSMATIVELPPLEEQKPSLEEQRLSDKRDEIFPSIVILSEEQQQQIKPSNVQNQLKIEAIEQEQQSAEATEATQAMFQSGIDVMINERNE